MPKKKKKKTVTEIKCPSCGNTDLDTIEWQEWVVVSRKLNELTEGTLLVDGGSEKMDFESGKDESLYCKGCYSEFPIPDGLDVDHV